MNAAGMPVVDPAPGQLVPDTAFRTIDGVAASLRHPPGRLGTVFITRDIECPVSQRYLPRIVEMARTYRAQGFEFILLDITPHSRSAAKAAGSLPGVRTIVDDRKVLATTLGSITTAEAFVVDSHGSLRYRGAIDDQYGISFQRAGITSPWLRTALDNAIRGEEPQVRVTMPHGCPISPASIPKSAREPVTYHNRVSRIIQSRCQVCHRVGGLGPMPLENFRQVHERRDVIAAMVGAGRMPPWFARRDVGEWANDRSLSEQEKSDLLGWIKAGGPEGDPAEAPLPRHFAAGWNIGKPDAILPIPAPFKVPAQGTVAYQNFYIKTNFPGDRWVTAIEIKPTQPKVVHHALVYVEEPGRKPLTPEEFARIKPGDKVRALPADGVRGFFGATVPGSIGITFPDGMGKRIPKGAWLKLEIHYQPNGTELIDRTQVGFRFSKTPLQEVQSLSAFNTALDIPPNAKRYELRATYKFQDGGQLLSLFPHMHLRGSAFRFELKPANGPARTLLDVPRFDFGWQSYYQFKDPVTVDPGDELIATGWYDNSRENPWNPDPTQRVHWGLNTTDEMMIGYFDFTNAAAAAPANRGKR